MRTFIIIALVTIMTVASYNRDNAVAYDKKHWNSPNHKCSGKYTDYNPYSYFGGEHCSYGSHGGDCANFVSQCLIAGGHSPLNKGACRGYPCGKEEAERETSECALEIPMDGKALVAKIKSLQKTLRKVMF